MPRLSSLVVSCSLLSIAQALAAPPMPVAQQQGRLESAEPKTRSVAGQPEAKEETWIGRSVIPRPGAALKAAGSKKVLDMKSAASLPWKISHVNGDWLWIGNAWIKKQQVQPVGESAQEQALVKISESIRQDPDNAGYYVTRAFLRVQVDSDNAVADLNEALRLDPNNQFALQMRARHWEAIGNDERALADLSAAIEFNRALYLERALYYAKLGQHEKALADFDEAIKINPHNKVSRAQYFASRREWKLALADFSAGIEAAPKDFNAIAERAWLLATCPDDMIRNGNLALADAKKAYQLQQWQNTANALAAAYAEIGNFKAAVMFQQEAIEFAKQLGTSSLKDFELRLALYRQQKPYRDDVKK